MDALAARLVRRPSAWAIVIVTLLLTLAGALFAGQVRQEDDLLAFLPEGNPEIEAFRAISDVFGGLDVAMIGVETDDVFDPVFLAELDAATRAMKQVNGVDRVMTLSNVQDFVEDPIAGGVAIVPVIGSPPGSDEARAALAARVLSLDHVRDVVVSGDGQGALLFAFLAHGSEPRLVAGALRDAIAAAMPGRDLTFSGAPFISTWIFDTTQRDLRRLVPWAIAVIVFIMLVSFRDPLAAGLGLFATGVGILIARGTMGFLGVADNLVLSSMPVILFAVGSAYAIHIISRFYANYADKGDVDEAVAHTMKHTAPTVLAAGGTTVVGLLSFITMDIQPMRVFGTFTALGVAVAMLVAITFVPAVLVLWRPKLRREGPGLPEQLTAAWMTRVYNHRPLFGAITAGVLIVAGVFAARVDHRMDEAAFFSKDSPPERAARFLTERFGGSQFLQIHVRGDLSDPNVLREVQRVADRAAAVPGVANVQGIPSVVALVNRAMTGVQRVPDTRAQVGALFTFLTGDPSVSQLVTSDRDQALLQLKVSPTDLDALDQLQADVQALLDSALTRYETASTPEAAAWLRRVTAARIEAAARIRGGEVPDLAALEARLAGVRPDADAGAVRAGLVRFLNSEESWVPLEPGQAEAIAAAVAALGPEPGPAILDAAAEALGPDTPPETLDDLLMVLDTPTTDLWRVERGRALADALLAEGLVRAEAGAVRDDLIGALLHLDLDAGLVPTSTPDAASIAYVMTGQPVLYSAMSRSVQENQIKSLVFALLLVWAILSLLFRSPWSGLLATAPTLVTLTVIYGAMGYAGLRLDIGTSMIASLVIGAGVDYAVHTLNAWRAPAGAPIVEAAREAAFETGTAVWTNAAMVSAGFFVLTLGNARPLQNVGGLVSAAMLVAALATFLIIPLLARRRVYGR